MSKDFTPENIFKAAQSPSHWYLSARRLGEAAEIILANQQIREIPFSHAADEAAREARAISTRTGKDGVAEIKADAPNYLSAQLLYAFAIENALKGLLVQKEPGLPDISRVSRQLVTHELDVLAQKADVTLTSQELSVLKALSHIAVWAGRYPVATFLEDYRDSNNPYPFGADPESLLDYGLAHPIMRGFFERIMNDLRDAMGNEPSRFSAIVSFATKS